jgi:hypothetical protein
MASNYLLRPTSLKVRSDFTSIALLVMPFSKNILTTITEDGLFVLLKPEKKNKKSGSSVIDRSLVPPHLIHLAVKTSFEEICPWSLSGPQFPQPTAIQQRYCYPRGSEEYSSRKGGALWTMYGPDGQENLDFRLLHVYFSAKRAVNKGISNAEIEKEQLKRHRDDISATTPGSIGSWSTMSKKQRKSSYISDERSKRSPWQQPHRHTPQQKMPLPTKYRRSPGIGYNIGPDFLSARHPSPSPYRSQNIQSARPSGTPIYVSPNGGSAATQPEIERTSSNENSNTFDGRNFHPLASFDAEDVEASLKALSTTGNVAHHARSDSRSSIFRLRNNTDGGREDSNTQILHLLDGHSFENSLMGLEHVWRSDPDFKINVNFSQDEPEFLRNGVSKTTENESSYRLIRRLEKLHGKICQGILSHPPEDRGSLVSIVANWARCLARSPLEPLPRSVQGWMNDTVSTQSQSVSIKLEDIEENRDDGNAVAV